MKRLIALFFLTVSVSAMAQPGFRYYHHHGYYPGPNYGWVAPTIIGGVIGYELSRPYYAPPPPVYYPPPPVVYTQPPVYVQQPQPYQQTCTRYITQNEQGQTVREETRCN